MNIPIYRAKKIDSDEYVYGYYTERVHHYPSGRHYIHFHNGLVATYERIDPTTLSIHFPDMLDSQGNRIFASLSEDGKGGDILKNDEYEFVAKYSDCGIILRSKTGELFMGAEYIEINNLKVTGIQK